MAKINGNIFLNRVSGMVGDQIVLRKRKDGQTILAIRPTPPEERVYSEAQLARQQSFREAIRYAQAAQEQEIYRLKADGTGRSPFNIAVGDWFKAPVIEGVNLSGWNGAMGEPIRVIAYDDTRVTHVIVRILDADGNLQEEGRATDSGARWWDYQTRGNHAGAMTVHVTASDLPGNQAELSQAKTIPE